MKYVFLGFIFLVTILTSLIKLHFEFYHFLYPIVLIILLWRIEIHGKTKSNRKKFAIGMIILNISILLIPDSYVYKVLNKDTYFWSEKKLEISHFKGAPQNNNQLMAVVFPSMVGKISRVHNYPGAIMFTSDSNTKSWISSDFLNESKSNQKALRQLLLHEKRHLDVTEVYLRKAMDSIDNLFFPSYENKFQILSHFFHMSDSINNVFDLETKHGIDTEYNKKWDNYVDSELMQ